MLPKDKSALLGLIAWSLFFTSGCTSEVQPDEGSLPQESTITPVEEIASSEETSEEDRLTKPDFSSSKGIIPTHLSIPAINVSAGIEPYGLDDNGAMEVPGNGETIAWFEPGTKPGSSGNAVLAAHVDDYTGPAVFFDLKMLKKGDEIYVTDGERILTFVVTHKEAYPYNEAPIRTIFGPSNKQQLNLITCTGLYNRKTNNHEQRLVVYTEQKET